MFVLVKGLPCRTNSFGLLRPFDTKSGFQFCFCGIQRVWISIWDTTKLLPLCRRRTASHTHKKKGILNAFGVTFKRLPPSTPWGWHFAPQKVVLWRLTPPTGRGGSFVHGSAAGQTLLKLSNEKVNWNKRDLTAKFSHARPLRSAHQPRPLAKRRRHSLSCSWVSGGALKLRREAKVCCVLEIFATAAYRSVCMWVGGEGLHRVGLAQRSARRPLFNIFISL